MNIIRRESPDLKESYEAKIEVDKLNSLVFQVPFDTNFDKSITKNHHNWVDDYFIQKKYFEENPDDLKDIVKATAFGAGVGFCMASGYFFLMSLFKIALWATYKTIHVIGGIFFGTVVGAATVGSARYVYFTINKAHEFADWKMKMFKTAVYEQFQQCVAEDEYLKGRICPISISLIVDPVMTKECGHIFERACLEEHLNIQQNCPKCRKDIKKIDLKYAENYQVEVCQRVMKILEFVKDENLREGMKKYVHVQIKEQTEILKNKLTKIIDLNKNGEITNVVFHQYRETILQTMDTWNSWKGAVS
jgi:predicted Zn-ribbon and HTH transcriptional regulator